MLKNAEENFPAFFCDDFRKMNRIGWRENFFKSYPRAPILKKLFRVHRFCTERKPVAIDLL